MYNNEEHDQVLNNYRKRIPGWSPSPKKNKLNSRQSFANNKSLTKSSLPEGYKSSTSRQLTFINEDDQVLDNTLKQKTVNQMINKDQHHIESSSNPSESNKSTNDNDCLNQILRNITFLKYELKQVLSNQVIIMQRLETLENLLEQNPTRFDMKENNVDFTDCPLPISNEIDLNTLEDKISSDRIFKNQLMSELSYIGGKNVKLTIKRLMSKLFTNGLLSNYSYSGRKGKKILKP